MQYLLVEAKYLHVDDYGDRQRNSNVEWSSQSRGSEIENNNT
jgi:hypothetical protein